MADENRYQFTMADGKEAPKRSRLLPGLGVSLLLLSVAVLAAIIAMIYQYFALAGRMDSLTVTCKPADVLKQYPGYFRTPLEQIEVERRFKQSSNYEFTRPLPNCTLNCGARFQRDTSHASSLTAGTHVMRKVSRIRRQEIPNVEIGDNPLFHACCESMKSWVTPTTALNERGETVLVVQLEEKKQYFLQESCKSVKGCNICTCAQPEPFFVTAVIYQNEDKTELKTDVIQFPGCCKCLNIGVQT